MGKEYFFFGEIDRKGGRPDGDISSERPAWMMKRHVEELETEMTSIRGQIDRGEVRPEDRADRENKLRLLERKIELAKRPEYTGEQKDEMFKERKLLAENIKDKMPTRSEMDLGTADAHLEADRMSLPCVDIGNETIARRCGVTNIVNGRVSRNDAHKIWSILGAALDTDGNETTNPEDLRRDRVTQAGKKKYFAGVDLPKE